MMRPPRPWATIRRAAAWAHTKAPVRSTSSTWFHWSRGTSRNGVDDPVPALFTRTSMPPRASIRSSMTAAPDAGSLRSSWRTSARALAARTSAAVCSAPSSSPCHVIPMSQPDLASSTAVAFPIPESAPVTIAIRAMPVSYPLDGVELIGLAENVDRLLHRPPGPGQPALVDGQLAAAGVDRLAQPNDGEVGQLLGDALESVADVVE